MNSCKNLKLNWKILKCSKEEIRIDITLKCGQSFRWKPLEIANPEVNNIAFVGVVKKRLWVLGQNESSILYHCVNEPEAEDLADDLKDYFQLSVSLQELYKGWSQVDPVFENLSVDFPGVRILRQDPTENLFSFICSANNNIQRISGMVENMCKQYGEVLASFQEQKYHAFPTLEALREAPVEDKLRELGFGYRAKYIRQAADQIINAGGEDWLKEARGMPYKEAKDRLRMLSGVGPKVADCVLLMSLDHPESVPVDTHMFQIAAKQYLPHLREHKTVTDKVYAEVADHFRKLYGEYAGWAHSVLFSADLRHLQSLKSPEKRKIEEGGRKESPKKKFSEKRKIEKDIKKESPSKKSPEK